MRRQTREALVTYVRSIGRRVAFVLAACLVMTPLAATPRTPQQKSSI
jgi:hypothetical protein